MSTIQKSADQANLVSYLNDWKNWAMFLWFAVCAIIFKDILAIEGADQMTVFLLMVIVPLSVISYMIGHRFKAIIFMIVLVVSCILLWLWV